MENEMKKIRSYFTAVLAGILLAFTGCDFGDLNVDPTQLSAVNLRDMLPTAQSQTAFNQGALAGRMPGIIMQHFIGFDAQQLAYTRYVFNESDLNNLWVTGMYVGAMRDCDVIIKQAAEEGQPYYSGIAKILMAHSLGVITTFFGDVPFSEAFEGSENLKPKFDTQEEVYTAIQTLLSEAVSELSQPAVPGGPASDDLIFGGNAARWIAAAHSMKARFHLHLVKRDPQAASKALAELASGITGVATEVRFRFGAGTTESNPYSQFGQQRPNTLLIHPQFQEWMDSNADPRIPKYMENTSNGWVFFNGPNNTNLYWAYNAAPMTLMSYTESKFLEAEARLRTATDAAGITAAETALKEAVEASMTQLGIAPASFAAYVAARATFAGLADAEERLERIMEEKYVALYAQSEPEIWTDFRRTGYPSITPAEGGTNGLNPSGQLPRRFIYPIDERSTNTDSMNEAISRLGTDNLSTDIWAFKN
jgi:hypothetical protein